MSRCTDLRLGQQFQTPDIICDYMASLVPDDVIDVLEPTPGERKLVKALENRGLQVTAPIDFFLLDKSVRYGAVVMNPPFALKYTITDNAPESFKAQGMEAGYWFLTEAMKLSDNVIALMPWFTISDSDVRMRKLIEWGLVSITALRRKAFQYARIQTMVLQLQKGYAGKHEFKYFDLANK